MKLNEVIIEEISKKLKAGIYAKVAARAEGITERTFQRWKSEGKAILERITNKDGEIIDKEWEKLTHPEKLKCHFCQSLDRSDAEGETVLVASIYSHIKDDWRAAELILSRKWPERWAKKEYLHVDQETIEKPDELQEIEDDIFEGIPESKRGAVIKEMTEAIEGARDGKAGGKAKEKSKTAS